MAIIPQTEKLIFALIACPVCKKYYYRTPQSSEVACAINHSPGSCCHYADKELSDYAAGILIQIAHDPPKEQPKKKEKKKKNDSNKS